MRRAFFPALAGLLMLQSPALAQEQNLLDVTCGQYLVALSIAAPAADAGKAEQELALQAQELELALLQALFVWLHQRAGMAQRSF